MVGIVDTVKLAGTLVLAIPAALAGLEFLFVRDQPAAGAALLVLAVGLVLLGRFAPTPSDLPKLLGKRVIRSDETKREEE